MPHTSLLDDVSNDLAIWIDQISTEIATAFVATRAPFSAPVSEEQKLEFYRSKLFNPDGSPNAAGRQAELQRLGSDGFGQVYKAVIKRYPELHIPTPEADLSVPEQWPQAGPPMPPGGPPRPPVGLPLGPAGTGPGSPGPPMPFPPRPPMMPPPGIRAMASGGIVTKPTVALIGEAGPEAVVPLGQYQPPGVNPNEQLADSQYRDPRYNPPQAQPQPLPANVSPWNDLIAQHAGDYANDPQFLRIAAAAARAESTDNPQQYQFGYKPDDPRTWEKFGGRGLWQFDIGPQGMGHGLTEDQLFDPNYQASQIVPQFASNYARMKAAYPTATEAQLAAMVYGATERPAGTYGGKWQSTDTDAYQNYLRAWNSLNPGG